MYILIHLYTHIQHQHECAREPTHEQSRSRKNEKQKDRLTIPKTREIGW